MKSGNILFEDARRPYMSLLAVIGFILITSSSRLWVYLHLNLGFVNLSYARAGQTAANSQVFLNRAGDFFKKAISFQQTYRDGYRGLGLVFLTQGEELRAVEAWRKAELPVATLLTFGGLAEEEGQREQALSWYRCATHLDFAAASDDFAKTLYSERRYKEAVQIWEKALAEFPDHTNRLYWWQGLVRSLRATEQWNVVLEKTALGLSEFPGDPWLLTERGRALYFGERDLQAAEHLILQAVESDLQFADACVAMAQIMTHEQRYIDAYTWYSRAITREPSIEWWYVARGNVARMAGDLPLAIAAYKAAIENMRTYAPAYYELAWAYKLDGQLAQAALTIEQALALLRSSDANYYIRAGQIYEQAGQVDKAVVAYQKVLELLPDNDKIRDRLEKLNE